MGVPGSLVGLFGCAMRRPDSIRSALGRAPKPAQRDARTRSELVPSADLVLPAGHPLARAMESFRCTGRQWADVAAILAGSLLARAQGARWAWSLAASAAAVLAALSIVLAARVQNRRDRAVEVILDGREELPLAPVQRERRRLVSRRTRTRLARSLQEVVGETAKPRRCLRPLPPLCEPRVVSPLVAELLEISVLLHGDEM